MLNNTAIPAQTQVLTPAQAKLISYLTTQLKHFPVNSAMWISINSTINKFYVAQITHTLQQ